MEMNTVIMVSLLLVLLFSLSLALMPITSNEQLEKKTGYSVSRIVQGPVPIVDKAKPYTMEAG
jgi:hypothetical protein